MRFPRSSGILLHPTSLPGRFGIGDMGPAAYRWVDFLASSGQGLWQILPLGPTGYGDSPYQSFSAFAGNPLLISAETLVEDGLLTESDLESVPAFPEYKVDYGVVIPYKISLLKRAFDNFRSHPLKKQQAAFAEFQASNSFWLDDYALFMALKEAHGGGSWSEWEDDICMRHPEALARRAVTLTDDVDFHMFVQFQFFKQWLDVKRYANQHKVRIVGDIPIFVAFDSSDVWANPDLFKLDESHQPTVVAGVPPDYFSDTGQLWGNPHYRWDVMKKNGFRWWIERFRATLAQVDIVRIDHFRGFAASWEVPAGDDTAVDGRWVDAPGADLFRAVEKALGELPIIAEDLGVITPDVVALRDQFDFPGMKVLQFAFTDDPRAMVADFVPHNFVRNCIVYTGTHDNDTTLGWFNAAKPGEREGVLRYIGVYGVNIPWAFIRLAFASVADMAVVPLQDVLSLGSEARMNLPSKTGGWWSWRFLPWMLTPDIADRLCDMATVYGRVPAEERHEERERKEGAPQAEAQGSGV